MACAPSDLVGDFAYFQGQIALPGDTAFHRICMQDNTRIAIILGGNLTNGYQWSLRQSPTGASALPKNGGALETILTFHDVGPVVCSEFWLADGGFATVVSWIEVYYRPVARNIG